MNRKQYLLMILLALVTGLIGGAVSSQLFTIETVFAEKTQIDKIWNETHPDEKTSPVEAEIIWNETEAEKKQKKREEAHKKWEETKGKEWRKGLKDIGRFQFHSSLPFILDTKEGHLWRFGSSKVNYLEQILPAR